MKVQYENNLSSMNKLGRNNQTKQKCHHMESAKKIIYRHQNTKGSEGLEKMNYDRSFQFLKVLQVSTN